MLTRRHFLSLSSVSLAASFAQPLTFSQTKPKALIKPARLQPGDLIGAITPSTPVADPERLSLVEQRLKHFGLRFKIGRHVGKKSGYFGSPVQDRLDDLHEMFRDPDIKGVLCIGGGYGTQHLLDRIDYDLIRRNPKVFVGYSDITALHLAIHQNTGLVTFHGPVLLSPFTAYTEQHYRRALFDARPLGALTNPPEENKLRPEHSLRTIRPGKATGRLIGGNLTLISTLMGTPYEPETRGAILFLEDVGEEPYRIDRMLTQLRLAGKLNQAAGLVFGECVDCGPSDFKPFVNAGFSLGEALDAILGDLKIPVLTGLTFGHTSDQLTLPVGVSATLDAGAGTLEITETSLT